MAEQAKILVAEAEEDNLSEKVLNERWGRWDRCSLCEQQYHGVVYCALGWACWKTYVGRPERDQLRCVAMSLLGNGLHDANHYEDALSVQEAELAMLRRLGAPECDILVVQGNLASTYRRLGRFEEALSMREKVYSGRLKLDGEEHISTIRAANNYAHSFLCLKRFKEGKKLLLKTIPVALRVLNEGNDLTLTMRWNYARALFLDAGATLDDRREAVTTLAEIEPIARRVMGGAHPLTVDVENDLQIYRDALVAAEQLHNT